MIKKFKTKSGQVATIRYPKKSDLKAMLGYINKLSQEDTFITYSGEKVIKKQEKEFLDGILKGIKNHDKVCLLTFVDDNLAGVCTIERNKKGKKRTHHIAIFGISIAKKYRGQGIGFELAQAAIQEAGKRITDLRIITLNVYGINNIAQNLYQKLGFKKFGRLPQGIFYHQKYIDELKMYLDLK